MEKTLHGNTDSSCKISSFFCSHLIGKKFSKVMYVKMVPCKLHIEKLSLFKLYSGYRIVRVLCRHSLVLSMVDMYASDRGDYESVGTVGKLSSGNKNKWREMHIHKLSVHMLVIRNYGNIRVTLSWAPNKRANSIRAKYLARRIFFTNQGSFKWKAHLKLFSWFVVVPHLFRNFM